MEKSWRNNAAVKVLSALTAILMLWMTIVCVCCTLLCLSAGYYSNPLDTNEIVLRNHMRTKKADISAYYQIYNASIQSKEQSNLYQNELAYYEALFNTEQTNLRFVVTDSLGNPLLSNDPTHDSKQSILTTYSENYSVYGNTERYEKIVHFADYNSILQADWGSYLDKPEDFECWFFADDEVDAIRDTRFEFFLISYSNGEPIVFPSMEAANAVDFKAAYGEDCKVFISEMPDSGEVSVIVQRPSYESMYGTLEEYYHYRDYHEREKDGVVVRAASKSLESKLKEGLDIAVIGWTHPSELCQIRSYLPKNLTVKDDIYEDVSLMKTLFRFRKLFLVGCFVCATFAIAASIALCTTAGHVRGSEKLVVSRVQRIGFELFWLLPVACLFVTGCILVFTYDINISWGAVALLSGGLILADSASIILLLYSIAIRSKAGTFWSSFFFVRIITKFFVLFNNKVTTCLFALLYCFFLFLANIILPQTFGSSILNLLAIMFDFFTLLLILYLIYGYYELRRHVDCMVRGEFDPIQPPIPLVLDFAAFSASLDNMTDGIQAIVEQQTRAERMRTELITNVSHDLKTPLTSIVNYTDLLSREPMLTEHAAEYLEVLKRQSARLQKLTVDLVDASKASSGALSVDLQPMELQVLIPQLVCEYEDKLASRELSLVTAFPEQSVQILADGRHLFRVLSNLLGNACKYSMPASRIYLDVTEERGIVAITIKNISQHALNVTPDELTERFVRGDASRHTEGSGLGLSIAKDLTRLQGGELSLQIDGDLFKAIVRFPLYRP